MCLSIALLWCVFYSRKLSLTQIEKCWFLLLKRENVIMYTGWYIYLILQGQQRIQSKVICHMWAYNLVCYEHHTVYINCRDDLYCVTSYNHVCWLAFTELFQYSERELIFLLYNSTLISSNIVLYDLSPALWEVMSHKIKIILINLKITWSVFSLWHISTLHVLAWLHTYAIS